MLNLYIYYVQFYFNCYLLLGVAGVGQPCDGLEPCTQYLQVFDDEFENCIWI